MTPLDRMKEYFRAFILQRLAELAVDFHALYRCTVISQKGDGTLELRPDKPGIAAPTGVKFRCLPGAKVTFDAGARVLLGFEDGNPTKPYATAAEDTKLKELVLSASSKITIDAPEVLLGQGLRKPICVGDIVSGLVSAAPSSPVTGTYGTTDAATRRVKV